ncbi:hypothetical protein BDV98DRAFT_573086 [Pterulicium gracile]|uniref:Uncharacterized protein n=1 Tax=Pterulicium gracile TaxID=1884261 RepID=A0A5C3QJ75_9AGAR|nr:hypothetical protein BDV98DRAFT_573086 [Pterula gracilis]
MTIPCLQTLFVSLGSPVFSRQTLDTSLPFVSQFNTSLTSLSVHWPLYNSLTHDGGRQFFTLLFSLQSLRLHISSLACDVLRILTWQPSEGSSSYATQICPALPKLHCNPKELRPDGDPQAPLDFSAWKPLRVMGESRLPSSETNQGPSAEHSFIRVVTLGPILFRHWEDASGQEEEGLDNIENKAAFDWLVKANNARLFEFRLAYAENTVSSDDGV